MAILGAAEGVVAGAPASKEPAPAQNQQIAKLIESLGDKDYAVRQRAEEELARIGLPAYEALEAASNHEDLEIAARARYLLRKMRAQWASRQDPPEVRQLLEEYDLQTVEDRADRIRRLAALPDLGGAPALCRLIRIERSAALSAYAALEIMYQEPFDQTSRLRLNGLVKANLTASSRPAAKWLLTYVRLRDEPKTALPEWRKLVESEYTRWQQAPEKVSAETVVGLVYLLAQSQADQGDRAAAEKTAQRARQMPQPSDLAGFELRMQTAWMLAQRGLSAWAEAEFRLLMSCGQPAVAAYSGQQLAEYLHDQGKDLAAAEIYEKILNQTGPIPFGAGEELDSVRHRRARMNYFQACHWAQQHDAAKELQFLERALQADPSEVDTLIACSRLPNPSPQFRQGVAKLIQQETKRSRDMMVKEPKSALACNQFAWLVGNTQGDLDEALRASQKSLELSPNNSAYLDTLAHVCFAKGDLRSAVKYQTMAAQREPHSGLLNSELKRFRAALEAESKKAPAKRPDKPEAATKDREQ